MTSPKLKIKIDDFVERLRSKTEEVRSRAWVNLKNYIVTELSEENKDHVTLFMNQLNTEIEKMRSSNDTNAKKGAILAIDVLINVDVGNTSKTITRSENHLKDILAKENDPALLQMTASVIGNLALRAGQAAGNIVDFQNNKAIEELSSERQEKNESRRLAAVFILRELALCTPTLFYQSIARFFDSIFKPIRDPKSIVRVQAVAALRAALGIVAQRENLEDSFYKMCLDHCMMEFNPERLSLEKVKPTRDDWSHGTLLIIEELLRSSNMDGEKLYEEISTISEIQSAHEKQTSKVVTTSPRRISIPFVTAKPRSATSAAEGGRFSINEMSSDSLRKEPLYESTLCRRLITENFTRLCQIVFSHKANRNAFIQQALISLLPRLAAFNPKEFVNKAYLKIAIAYLLGLLRRERDKSSLFIALGLVCVAVGKDIRPHLDEILEVICSSLPRDLPQKKQKSVAVEPSVFTCISLLARAMGSSNDIHMRIRELIGPMLHVPLSPSLTSALEDIAKQIPSLRRDIQDGLLQMLSLILTGRPTNQQAGARLAIQTPTVYDSSGISHDLTNITLALRTLGTFDFEDHSLTKLLRHCADKFLGSDNEEVRMEAVKTCSSLLTYTSSKSLRQSSQAHTVAEVLNKLLIVGITDSDPDIRRCVLESLNTNHAQFDPHLAQAENLASLFIALNDERFEIRAIAMVMIGKLSKKNPAYVMPSLRKVLIQLIAVLEHSGIGRDKEQAANMLYLLVHNAPRIIKPYLDAIVDALMSKLKEVDQNTAVMTAVLEALGGLCEVGGQKMLKYADDLLTIIEGMLEDSSSAHKQEVVVRTLGQVVASTGLVVEPYNRFPNLLMILLNMLVTEPEQIVRKEVIRLLGLLGALDPYRHKLNLGKIGGAEAAGAVVLSMWEPSGDRYDRADITTNEMLVAMATATLDEFYPAVAIACMMRIINEPSLAQFHLEAVSSINTIFMSLGIRSVQYIPQVVPACLKVMRENQSVRQFLFTQLSNVIGIVKLHIKPYLPDIFAIVDMTWSNSLENPEQSEDIQKTMIELLRCTVSSIATEFKLYLPDIIPHMLKVFITDKSERRTIIQQLLHAIQDFGINLDGYIHLLLPPIMQILDQTGVDTEVKILALKTVERLTDHLDLSDFASKIIHPIIRLLDSRDTILPAPLCKQAMATLCSLVTQLGKKYRIFIPMVQKILLKQRISDPRYNSLVREIADGSMYTPALRTNSHRHQSESDLPSTQIKQKQAVKPEELIRACRGTTRVSKEDWMEWLRRFNLEVLKLSPDPSLKACYILAQSYPTVAREMFNAAFVSCWTGLSDPHKKTLIEDIGNALDGQKIPEITQALLNLAEFMEHCDSKGSLPLSPALLGRQAVECRAYAKALHYVEEEFHEYIKTEKEGGAKHSQSTGMELMEKLISVNNKLQQTEAARGVLLYAKKKTLETSSTSRDVGMTMLPAGKIPGHFYEKLHQWEEAKRVYEEELLMENQARKSLREGGRVDQNKLQKRTLSSLGKMRCLEELGEWNAINDVLEGDDVCSWTKASDDLKEKMSRMAAASAWGRGDEKSMGSYVNFIAKDSFDGLFYRAVLKIMQAPEDSISMFRAAHEYINKARDLLSTDLAALASESYSRAYGVMVNVQMLTELEEVIQYKLVGDQRDCIKAMWWKRMNGCQKTVEDWSKLLRVHSLVLEPQEDTKPWLKFASLCRQNGRLAMAAEILKDLNQSSKTAGNKIALDVQLEIQIATLKHTWETSQDNDKEKALTNLRNFVRVHSNHLAHYRGSGRSLLSKCYLKLGSWTELTYGYTKEKIPDILEHYKEAVKQDPKWYKAWHAFAYTSYEAVLLYKSVTPDNAADAPAAEGAAAVAPAVVTTQVSRPGVSGDVDIIRFCVDAIEGFFKSISLSDGNSLQDTLRLLTLWFEYGEERRVYESLVKGLKLISIENWLQVIPQLIARIDTSRQSVGKLIQTLLCDISKHHPQALIYPLTVAAKSSVTQRRDAALHILNNMKEHSPNLVNQALLVSEELIRVAILWHELWHEGLEEASRLYFGDRNVKGMFETLEPLHQMLERGPQTLKEISFQHAYGQELSEALEWCKKYQRTHNVKELTKAWDSYYHVFRRISKQLPMLTSLELHYVSPKLLDARDLELAVPGTYDTKEVVGIQRVHSSLQVITSKQRPRKLSIYGSNGKEYQFVLKGHEDLRQDERVMQLFGLVNSLLLANADTCRRNLTIQRYSAIPLSTNSGLLGWVPHCDTLHQLIRDYRERKKILLNIEHRIMMRMAPDYDHLTLMQKVEVFEYALENTTGDDLAKVIWFKSPTSEVWFDRRTNFTRSLAVMSMVGYVLGLGDRHPSNLMLDRESGKIIHIDFGDCFEVAMSREKFPEKIPFRLTRMLINAMEVTGIDGNYRMTCERVMKVLRENKDSVMAVLEAFVYDPLLNWWLMEGKAAKQSKVNQEPSTAGAESATDSADLDIEASRVSKSGTASPSSSVKEPQGEIVNQKALNIIRRVKDKLTGRDFISSSNDRDVNVERQVELLIDQATSHANLCQCYIGWCPFW